MVGDTQKKMQINFLHKSQAVGLASRIDMSVICARKDAATPLSAYHAMSS
jgi:hypothetical protein